MSNDGYNKLEEEHEAITIPEEVRYPSIVDEDQVSSPSPIVDFPPSSNVLRDSTSIGMRHAIRNGTFV